jgi:hypothetical protein
MRSKIALMLGALVIAPVAFASDPGVTSTATQATAAGEAGTQTASAGDAGTAAAKPADAAKPTAGLGVELDKLSPVIDNPWVALASRKRAVYAGTEKDPDTGETVQVRMESVVRDKPEMVAGAKVTVVEVSDFDDGELIEKTKDYYAQHASGAVYYMGEHVDDFEDGKLTGHGGQWIAGENGAKAGVFMPAAPKVGDVFEQEQAPGVAEDRSKVVAKIDAVTVPAGKFEDCIEVEDFDPIGKTTQRKIYCKGVGLVREVFGEGQSIDLIELEKR